MTQVFDSKPRLVAELTRRLQSRLDGQTSDAIVALIADEFTAEGDVAALGMRLPFLRWAIRDDDLRMLDALSDGIKAALVAGFVVGAHSHSGTIAAAGGLGIAAAKLCRQVMRKTCSLSSLEYKVLLALLSSRDGVPDQAVVEWCSSFTCDSTPADELHETLKRLAAFPAKDGCVVALVSRAHDGNWRAAGV